MSEGIRQDQTLGRGDWWLTRLGCGVYVQEMEKNVYDIVLMDVHMPIIDGLEASRRIRDIYPEEDRPKIVALSADTTQACSISSQLFLEVSVSLQPVVLWYWFASGFKGQR